MTTARQFAKPVPPTGGGGLTGSRIVAPKISVSPASMFRGPTWNMEALVTTPGIPESSKSWNFESSPGYPGGFALSLAEYAYARLYKPVAIHDRQGEWLTVLNELYALKSFAEYCFNQGRIGFHQVDNRLLDRYLKLLSFDEGRSDERVRTICMCIYRLWEYGAEISEPMPTIPFGKPFRKMFPSKRGNSNTENKTPPIPEPVYAAIMGAALDYVLDYSPILLNALAELQSLWDTEIQPLDLSASGKSKRLSAGSVKIIEKANAHWRTTSLRSYGELYDELNQLRTACTLTILAYSGIRSTELLSLEAGCFVTDKGSDGQPMYYINTVLHKHRNGGTKDTWVVIEEVVKAIKVLEVLTRRIRKAANDQRLMLTDGHNSFFSVQKDFAGGKVSEYTQDAIVYQIQCFRNYCNWNLCREPIPEWLNDSGETKPWKFNVRQFRRTLARYIARQPFGIVAGMLQYKHVEVAIFQGYAGTEPEWNKLLEQEQVLASVDILGELAMDLSQGAVAGECGNHLKSEFVDEFKGRAEEFPPSQIAKWLASTHKGLFVGKFNFCFFDPAKALCTANADHKERPILNFCQPGQCGNACVGKRHKPMWEAQLNQAKEFAEHAKASEFQRHVLREEVAQLEAVINDFSSET